MVCKSINRISFKEITMPHICAICSILLNDSNNTKEHVIPNAIGGVKKIKNFICNRCNNESGANWDFELCGQLEHFSLLFQINRDRGSLSKKEFKTVDGRKIRVLPDGSMEHTKPTINLEEHAKGAKVHVSARNIKEAKQIVSGLSQKMSEKYPKAKPIDIDAIEFKAQREYLESPLEISKSYGGLSAGRSTVKSALAMVAESGVDVRCCEKAIPFLGGSKGSEPCFGFYYDKSDLVLNRPEGLPFHCVHVESDEQEKLIKGYVEYFGHLRYVLLLSSNYSGRSFRASYSINPLTGEELKLDINISLTKSDILDCYQYKRYDADVLNTAMGSILGTLAAIDRERQTEKEIHLAYEYALNKMGVTGDEELTKEDYMLFINHLTDCLAPYLVSMYRS